MAAAFAAIGSRPPKRMYRPAGGVATPRDMNPCQKRERPQYEAFGLPIRQKIKQGALRLSLTLLLELLLAVVFSKLPMRQKKASCALAGGHCSKACIYCTPAARRASCIPATQAATA